MDFQCFHSNPSDFSVLFWDFTFCLISIGSEIPFSDYFTVKLADSFLLGTDDLGFDC